MKTTVLELGTNREFFYTLPPEQAVVCAQYQYGENNWNSWTYDFARVQQGRSGKTVFCGDYCAMKDVTK